ncbi:MAG: hypothetical protein ACYC8T_11710 [Myxococcaceae bacterium]
MGTWLPTSMQITMASERAILAALDASLQLAVRALCAEHPSLDEERSRDLQAEPPPPHMALAGSIVTLAESLHELITGYRVVAERALGDAEDDDIF